MRAFGPKYLRQISNESPTGDANFKQSNIASAETCEMPIVYFEVVVPLIHEMAGVHGHQPLKFGLGAKQCTDAAQAFQSA